MKKRLTLIGLSVLLVAMLLIAGISTFAADGEFTRDITVTNISVNVGGKTISNAYSDPVDFWEVAGGGSLNNYEIRYDAVGDSDTVIYTAYYPDTTTGRTGNVTEYTCEIDNGKYVVTAVNTSGDGKTYIPVGGFVLSVSSSEHSALAKVGDVVSLDTSKVPENQKFVVPTKAVETSTGKRVVVDNTNANRAAPMVVYYDYQFGAKTGTNGFGTEVICQYDFDKNAFVVIGFRGFLQGDDSGSEIPDNGFVLSAYGEGYRQLLAAGELFSIGDTVKMVGFDFVRFGGTITGSFDHVTPTKETNPDGMETATDPFPAFRGTNQIGRAHV